ncbi:phage portal protein [Rhizobium sp. RU36D]|uniref:phage portal protein n=1 Tax=Rhizobium sp. RU36D TaxID=1907415 RepID=UPI0009D8F77E|nr:phage portal protein [Rhizobium sp. RU36D]SMD18515.1 phage portal protein, lambda family [Rhizobium sp. RU36D]
MNLIDSTIAWFSPEAGLRRAHARQLLDMGRDYAAAGSGRRNSNWRSRGTSATTEVGAALSALRDRSRAFVRDNWAGQRILDVLVGHAVGTGIMTVPDTGSDRDDRRYRNAREAWEESSDIERVLDYGGQQALMVRSMAEGGDCVARHLVTRIDDQRGVVPFRLQVIEGDLIDTSRDSRIVRGGTDERTRLGVALGQWNERLGLYLHPQHPGDQDVVKVETSILVDWSDLCHLYRPMRAGQLRGIPVFTPVLLPGRDVGDLMEAVIVQQKTQASFAGFIKRQAGGMNPLAAKEDPKTTQRITEIRPGQIQDIGEADIVFANPSSTSQFEQAAMMALMAMAAGAGITYDQLTGDLRQANYSSLRAGKIEFRRLIEQLQWHVIVPMLCRPVDRKFEQIAVMAGILRRKPEGYRVKHVMPAIEPIDPKKDLEADILAVRSGRMSPQEFISGWGRDWRTIVTDFEAFFSFCDANGLQGLMFDLDPRRPQSGAAPQAQAGGGSND